MPESWLPPIVTIQHDHGNIFNTNIELKVVIGDQQAAGHSGLQKKHSSRELWDNSKHTA